MIPPCHAKTVAGKSDVALDLIFEEKNSTGIKHRDKGKKRGKIDTREACSEQCILGQFSRHNNASPNTRQLDTHVEETISLLCTWPFIDG
jgi:hypothetical protein